MLNVFAASTYWVLMVLWLTILCLYIAPLRKALSSNKPAALLLLILAIDALRTAIESTYFGFYFNALYGYLPASILELLGRPGLLIVPKLVNVLAGLLILFLIVRFWIPRAIREQEDSENQLKLLANVFVQAREAIVITDIKGNILEVNRAFSEITQYDADEVIGKSTSILQSDRQEADFYAQLWRSLTEDGYWHGEIWNRKKTGEVYPELLTISAIRDEQGQTTHYIGMFTEISDLKAYEEQLAHIAHYDPLTGLPNRVLLADRLQQSISNSLRRKQSVAIAYLDIDDFKAVNDHYGHAVGDSLLIEISQRMGGSLRAGDTLARLGGDEFVAVLLDCQTASDCEISINRLLNAASQPVIVDGHEHVVSASIGFTVYPADNADSEQLIRHADQAMYMAKQSGKNRIALFDVAQAAMLKQHSSSVEQIQTALDKNEFVLFYQPAVNMRTGALIGVEALIRWQHPERGLLLPGAFLPETEDEAIAIDIGEWVIENALAQSAAWQAMSLTVPISINIGARQLQSNAFVDKLEAALAKQPEVDPSHITLEILETSALADIDQVTSVMHRCSAIGIDFALDDFGTGYSSLSYLKGLPARRLKIDQSFVKDMLEDPDDRAIVSAVIGLASAFQQQVIAEGVESVIHGRQLVQMGCELAQGYGIARPMPAGEIPGWIASWEPDPSWH